MKTLSPSLRHIVAMAALAVSTGAIASAQYKFVKLTIPGAIVTTVSGINNDNLITGTYETNTGYYGFTYNPSTKAWHYPIADSKGSATFALASNTSGTIVGYYTNALGQIVAGMSDEGGSFSNVAPSGCEPGAIVAGIGDSAYQTMTGSCAVGAQIHAFVTGPANVTFACFGNYTAANAISNWLLTVGYYMASDGQTSGFLSTEYGDCTTINYPGAVNTRLTGVNDYGTMAGTYWPTKKGKAHAFLTDGTTFTAVKVPHAKATTLGQINNNNWFVGNYIDSEGTNQAFYAVPATAASTVVEAGK